ncbi:MAG: UDP-3-O-(3-hydroxymyristoyl)glucosamine N-acyltransferase [Candidatus Omnitrophota bacterium]
MKKTLREIASAVNAKIIGKEDIVITGISDIKEAQEGDITFLAHPKYKPFAEKTKASAIIASKDARFPSKTVLQTENPSLAFTKVISMFRPSQPRHPKGIDVKAAINKNARVSGNASVGAYSVVEDAAEIADGVIIYSNCYIGAGVKIDKDTIIYPNVTIMEGTKIGSNVVIHAGSVIGCDGFGYIEVDGTHHKIPQVGIVVIEDDVEIGANTTIDRARFGQTVIGKGTKIDNLVQIAHNVKIGSNSIIIAQAGISGSSSVGKNTILAGQAGLVGHIELGDNVIVGAQCGVTKSFGSNTILLGSPANPIAEQKKIFACINKLPELFATIRKIKKKLFPEDAETEDLKEGS